jgi:hypothetical protein
MALQCGILQFVHNGTILIVGSSLVYCGIWIELSHRFFSRVKWGYLDTAHRLADKPQLRRRSLDITEIVLPSRLQMVRDFAFLFAKLVSAVILGYWSLFVALTRWTSELPFAGLTQQTSPVLDLLYFSIVTLATVGYGDIYPKTGVARMLVASEIIAGFSLLVLLLTAFSLSAETEELIDQRR